MVKFLILLFCVTQVIWASTRSLDEDYNVVSVSVSIDHAKIFEAIVSDNFAKAKDRVSEFRESMVSNTLPRETVAKGIDEFTKFFESYEIPDNTKITQLRNSAIVCGVAAAAECVRFTLCTDDSWCYWMPFVFAATAGGNFAVALTQLTDNSYILGATCAAACGIASLQNVNSWQMPGFFNPIGGNLVGFFGKKLLAASNANPNSGLRKSNSLRDYFTRLKSDEMRGLLSEYLSTVAFSQNWQTDPTLLHGRALVHLRELELR